MASAGHSGGEPVSTPRLVRVVRHFAGRTNGVVYDPACGIGDLLLSVGGTNVGGRVGQDAAVSICGRCGARPGSPGLDGIVRMNDLTYADLTPRPGNGRTCCAA